MTSDRPAGEPDAVRLPDDRMIGRLVAEPAPALSPATSTAMPEDPDVTVRPFIITRGRTAPGGVTLPVEAQVRAVPGAHPGAAGPEAARLLDLCSAGSQSIAELSAALQLPIGVARVLLVDLLDANAVVVQQPATVTPAAIERILERIHAL